MSAILAQCVPEADILVSTTEALFSALGGIVRNASAPQLREGALLARSAGTEILTGVSRILGRAEQLLLIARLLDEVEADESDVNDDKVAGAGE